MIRWLGLALSTLMACSTEAPPAPCCGTGADMAGGVPVQMLASAVAAAPASAKPEALASATRGFGASLWRALAERDGNLAVSPASLVMGLGMAWGGARGDTAREMAEVLHLGDDPAHVHASAARLLAAWNDPKGDATTLRVANRLFAQQGLALLPAYTSTLQEYYRAPVALVPFQSNAEAARSEINRWVADQTQDKIPELVARGMLTPLTKMVLANAVYFKSTWRTPFDVKGTQTQPFCQDPKQSRPAPMMHAVHRFAYHANPQTQVLEMPYTGEDLSMVLVLPEQRFGLRALETSLTAATLERWIANLEPQKVDVYLPRFTIDAAAPMDLRDVLTKMGMPTAFGAQADFSGMASVEAGLQIDAVAHETFVQVNEKGTEAAAATGVMIAVRNGGGRRGPPVFRADQPFLFFIRDVRSNALLFMGRVVEPELAAASRK